MRTSLIVLILLATAHHIHASPSPTSIHIANSSDQPLTIWVNGDAHELPVDSGLLFPCIENERHAIQTERELKLVSCGDSVEVNR